MKNKLQSVTNTPSSSSRRPRTSSKANRDHRKDSSLERSDNESTEDEDSDHNAPLPSQSHKLKSPGPSSNTPSTPVSSSSPEIEASIQGVVDEALLAAIKETVRANPLSEKIPVTVLQETLQEIRSEIKSQVALTISVSSSRFHWSQRIKEYSESYFETKRSDQSHEGSITVPADVKEEIQSMVKKSLSIPAGKLLGLNLWLIIL